MKVRAIKRRFSGVVKRRLLSPWLWRSAEDIAWDRSRPVGREFGSPDHDRLMALDEAAFATLGSIERVRQWLDAPNSQLDGMCPEDVARSPEGWANVMNLLKKVV